jgi:hypothetical protein
MWFQLGRDQREIVAGVVIDGEARWLKALVRPSSVTAGIYTEVAPKQH